MTLDDFSLSCSRFGRGGKLTAYLQGGLSVTGTWTYLRGAAPTGRPTSIVITDGNGARTVAPIETITAIREVPELTAKKSPFAGLGSADIAGWTKRGREALSGTDALGTVG